jgi:hypothetical protein
MVSHRVSIYLYTTSHLDENVRFIKDAAMTVPSDGTVWARMRLSPKTLAASVSGQTEN